MAGKKRRSRCEQCKGMFQYGEEEKTTHKLHSMYKTYRLSLVFCSNDCLFEYVAKIMTINGE